MLISICLIKGLATTVEANFYTQKQENQRPIMVRPTDSVRLSCNGASVFIKEPLYFSLIHPEEACFGKSFNGTLDFKSEPFMAKRVINQWLYNHFRNHADAVRFNKVGQLEVWIKDSEQPSGKTKTTQYLRFSISPLHDFMGHPWSLRVSFDGISLAYNTPLSQLPGLNAKTYRVLVDGEIVHNDCLTRRHRRLLTQAFPIINKELASELKIAEKRYRNTQKYMSTKSYIESFCSEYLFKYDIEQIQFANAHPFSPVPSSHLLKVSEGSEILVFGNNAENKDPRKGLEDNGVFQPSPYAQINLFFIYQKAHREVATRLYNVFFNGYNSPIANDPDKQINDTNTLSCKMSENIRSIPNGRIEFTSSETAYDEIEAGLTKKYRDPREHYVAIFISPVSKDGVNNPDHELYYQVKEMLLRRGIVCQAIFYENPSKPKFHLHIPNIASALSAKLGGIPWKLKTYNPNMDLVIGVGAFRSSLRHDCYLGSAFCFNGEGVFQGLNCHRHESNDKLVADIYQAIASFVKNNENRHPKRLIIHFYKKMNKREAGQIMDMLLGLNYNIPVYIVTVNKTETCDFFAFDENSPYLMPPSGTIVKLNPGDFLLYNNAYYGSKVPKVFLFPIRLRMTKVVKGKEQTALSDEESSDMLDKVYQFSRLYWKSVSLQSLPVTIAYSEMLAEIVPHFRDGYMPPFGKTSLWPL